jgi:hypothetical protein
MNGLGKQLTKTFNNVSSNMTTGEAAAAPTK